jgi:hypothetical protein
MAVPSTHFVAVSPRTRHAARTWAAQCGTVDDCLAGARGMILGLPVALALWTGIIALIRTTL